MKYTPVLAQQVPGSWRAQSEIFSELFLVFLVIGTVVGIAVVAYTLHHVYKYRDKGSDSDSADDDGSRPILGELPQGQEGGKSKKLFVSFGLSALIVISVVVYSFGLLLYVEEGPTQEDVEAQAEGNLDVDVQGIQYGWQFEYPNGQTSFNELRVPAGEDQVVRVHVTSGDVWHTFGVPEKRVKADAIPGQTSTTWFIADEPGTYQIKCFELCGEGHSRMVGELIVMEQDEFNEWYEGEYPPASSDSQNATAEGDA